MVGLSSPMAKAMHEFMNLMSTGHCKVTPERVCDKGGGTCRMNDFRNVDIEEDLDP